MIYIRLFNKFLHLASYQCSRYAWEASIRFNQPISSRWQKDFRSLERRFRHSSVWCCETEQILLRV